MQEQIKLRNNFRDIDIAKVAYIDYEIYEEVPDFSTFTYGSQHTIVLRNKKTRELERINYTISGSNGDMFPESKRIWGDVEAEDSATAHCCLCFYLTPDQKGVEDVAASFCAQAGLANSPQKLKRKYVVRQT